MTNEIKLKKDTAEILAFRTEGAEAANEGSGANKPQICALVKLFGWQLCSERGVNLPWRGNKKHTTKMN